MNTFKTLFTIALLGMSNLAMAEGSSLLDRAHSTMDEFQSSITDDTDQGSSAGSGQVGHSGGVPNRLSGQVDAGNNGRLSKIRLVESYSGPPPGGPYGDEEVCRNDYGGVVSGGDDSAYGNWGIDYINCVYIE